MRTLIHERLATTLAARIVHRDPPLTAFNEDHEGGNQHHHGHDHNHANRRQLPGTGQLAGTQDRTRQARNNARENEQGDPVTDATLGDLLTQPHQEHGSGCQAHHCSKQEAQTRIDHDLDSALRRTRLQCQCHAQRLEHGQKDRSIAGVLGDLPTTGFAFLLQRLKAGNTGAQQLHHDGRRNVRHHAQGKQREAFQRATGEHVENVHDGAALLLHQLHHGLRVDPRHRHEGAETEHDHRTDHKQQALPQLGQATGTPNSRQ